MVVSLPAAYTDVDAITDAIDCQRAGVLFVGLEGDALSQYILIAVNFNFNQRCIRYALRHYQRAIAVIFRLGCNVVSAAGCSRNAGRKVDGSINLHAEHCHFCAFHISIRVAVAAFQLDYNMIRFCTFILLKIKYY